MLLVRSFWDTSIWSALLTLLAMLDSPRALSEALRLDRQFQKVLISVFECNHILFYATPATHRAE